MIAMDGMRCRAAVGAPMTIAALAEQLKRGPQTPRTMPVNAGVNRSAWLERASPSCKAQLLLPSRASSQMS